MKIRLKDKALIEDYIFALTSVEKVLWQRDMGEPPQYLENYNPSFFYEAWLFILFLIISFTISSGGICFILFLSAGPCSLFLVHYYQEARHQKLDFARSQTQYIITNKRIIFILYQKETINIESILYENIEKVYSNKKLGDAANIYFKTTEPPNFETFKYWSQKPHEKIVMVQVEEHQRALDIVQGHLF